MDYVPCNRRGANQTWLLSAIMAHNLNRELQMSADKPERGTTEQRAPWWSFVRLGTRREIRDGLVNVAARLFPGNDRLQFQLRPAAFGALRTWVRSFLK